MAGPVLRARRSEWLHYVLTERHDGLVEVSLTNVVRADEKTLDTSVVIPFRYLGTPLTRDELDQILEKHPRQPWQKAGEQSHFC
jgi:hypothetical protein